MSERIIAEEDRVRPGAGELQLWFALLGGAAAWAVHFMAAYLLMEVACRAGWQQRGALGLNGAALALLGATLIALPVVVASGLVARRALRDAQARSETKDGYRAHLGQAGSVLALIFTLAIVAETVPALVLMPCLPGA
jgi:hypothetical protein